MIENRMQLNSASAQSEMPKSVNRSDLIQKMTQRLDYLTMEDSKYAVSALFNYMSKTLSQNKRIELRGFGTFSTRKHNQKLTRNLRTAQNVFVPPRYSPHFKPGSSLKNRVNDSKDRVALRTSKF